MPKRMTRQTLRILDAFMSDLNRRWYGLELMELTGLKSGTVYPIVHRLREDGWLTSALEEIDPSQEERPARRLYQLTGLGEREAASILGERSAREGLASPLPALHPKGVAI